MICEKCLKEIPDDSEHCPYCGKQFTLEKKKEVDDPSILWFLFGLFLFPFALYIAGAMIRAGRPETGKKIAAGVYSVVPAVLFLVMIYHLCW